MPINPFKFIKPILWICAFLFVIYAVYLVGINIHAKMEYEPNNVAKKFVSLIDNPTDRITVEEKTILQNITEGSSFMGISNFLDKSNVDENKIKELRELAQKNPIQISPLSLTGNSQKNGIIELTLKNDYQNPNSKKAKIYLQEYGNWYWTGYRWRIFQIDMPQKDSPIDSTIQKGQGIFQNILGGFKNNSFNNPSSNSTQNLGNSQPNSLQNTPTNSQISAQNSENLSSKAKCNFWEKC